MNFEPKKITREHVLSGVQRIENEGVSLIASTRWLVEINGKSYPPKEIMRYAHEEMNGEHIWEHGGGPPTNKFLAKLGFTISDKAAVTDPVSDLIVKYKAELTANGLNDEAYKWEMLKIFGGRPDTNAVDFSNELRTVDYRNLIYPVGLGVVHHLAKERTDAYRECFKVLFDEQRPLQERIQYFNTHTLEIYREIVPEQKFSHHQDERTMATFLTYHNPDKYTFYKDSFYQKYCKLIGVKAKNKGEKYIHYLELVHNFIEDYVSNDEELLGMVSNLTGDNHFKDENHLLLAQDILYRTLDKLVGVNRKYWRMGTSDGTDSYWQFMLDNGKAEIGWGDIGDLDDADVKDKKTIAQLLSDAGYYTDNNSLRSRKAGEIYNFYADLHIGDVVLAQDGQRVLGIGIVSDEYHYDGEHAFSHQKDIEWKVVDPKLSNAHGNQTTFYQLTDFTLINQIDALLENPNHLPTNKKSRTMSNTSLNQILYGPPGTGKTYTTVRLSLETLGDNLDGLDREGVKKLFDKRVNEGRIVFTTFHQSLSYEDFNEGIKPISPDEEGQSLSYKVLNGIFKRLCVDAERKTTLNFDDTYSKLIQAIMNKGNDFFELKTRTGSSFWLKVNRNNNLSVFTSDKKNYQGSMTKENLEIFAGGTPVFIGWEGYANSVIEYLKKSFKLSDAHIDNSQKPFVLIIDEINRGNVSQIFGELITLIEEDKRIGKPEAITVTLPYSGTKFGVPANIHIIGTMNTADRSVEALDAALRRRFTFLEMPPIPKLIQEEGNKIHELEIEGTTINLVDILTKINSRLNVLLDKDHLIGHSFFMKVTDIESLKVAFSKEILPLLQEYFFGDYGKISLVLGEAFCKGAKVGNTTSLFAAVTSGYDSSAYSEKLVYSITDPIQMADKEFKDALVKLMGQEGAV